MLVCDEVAQRDELARVLVAELARESEEARIAGRLAQPREAGEDLDVAARQPLAFDLAHDLRAHFLEHRRVERRLLAGELAELVGLDLLRQILRDLGLRAAQDEGVDRRAQPLGGALVARVDGARVALLELVERPEEAGRHEVEDRPDLAQAVLDRACRSGPAAGRPSGAWPRARWRSAGS